MMPLCIPRTEQTQQANPWYDNARGGMSLLATIYRFSTLRIPTCRIGNQELRQDVGPKQPLFQNRFNMVVGHIWDVRSVWGGQPGTFFVPEGGRSEMLRYCMCRSGGVSL